LSIIKHKGMNTGNSGFTATIITTAITTAFAITAGIFNHIMSGKRDRENQQKTASLKYTEQQLEELYGPLAFLIWEGRSTYTDLVKKFLEMRNEKHILESLKGKEKSQKYILESLKGKEENDYKIFPFKDEAEVELWTFWIEKDAFSRHEKIKKLLMTKTHLIEGITMPDSYHLFLNYHNSWKMEHLRWQEQKVKYLWISKFAFPKEFESDITETFERLKTRQTYFLKKIKN
jgi:hypothetical protein